MMELSLFILLQLNSLMITSSNEPATIFKYDSSNPAEEDTVYTCNNTNGCTFQCDGSLVCQAQFLCARNVGPCNLVCNGKESCRNSTFRCGTGRCKVYIDGESAMYDSEIHGDWASFLTVTVRGQYSLGLSTIFCPNGVFKQSNCLIQLGVSTVGTIPSPGIFTSHESEKSEAGFFIGGNERELRFQCEMPLTASGPFYIQNYGDERSYFCQETDYINGTFICEDDGRFVLGKTCPPFNATWPPLVDKTDDDVKIFAWVLLAICVVVLLFICCAYLWYRRKRRNERSYAERNYLYQASDGDDNMTVLVKNSMNKQQTMV